MLSICIPTYNRAALLEKNLKHLLTFSKLDIEVNISNNNSNDETLKVIEEYEQKFEKFNYISTDDTVDIADNFDLALHLATQQYTLVLCDDDLANESDLILGITLLEKEKDLVALYGGFKKYNLQNELLETLKHSETIDIYNLDNAHTLLNKFIALDLGIYRTELNKLLVNTHDNYCPMGWEAISTFLTQGNIGIVPYFFINHYSHDEQHSNTQNSCPEFHYLWNSQIEIFLSKLTCSSNDKFQALVNFKAKYYRYKMWRSYQINDLIHAHGAIKKGQLYNPDVFSGFAQEWDQKHLISAAIEDINNAILAKPHLKKVLVYSIEEKTLNYLYNLIKENLIIEPEKVTDESTVNDFDDQHDFIIFFNELDFDRAQSGKVYNSEIFMNVINSLKFTPQNITIQH